jgi:hypothetical protein
MNIKFVFEIIDSHISGYEKEMEDYIINNDAGNGAIGALLTLRKTLEKFIKEANDATKTSSK